jgi:hypothetical protein
MPETKIQTNNPVFDDFYPRIKKFLQADVSEFLLDGKLVRGYRSPDSKPIWLRDHTLMMCGYKYFEPDVVSAVEHFAEMQATNGRLFDYFVIGEERENWAKYVRVPVEADVEYYLPMAGHWAWQATGDDEWLSRMLPHCERALQYTMTHPWRWSSEYHLVKRAYTIDTWDFDYVEGRTPWLNFQIDDQTHFGIFHGDNSGFYDACNKLSFLFGHLGDHTQKAYWHAIAEGVQERTNQLCWNGRFYTHRMPLVGGELARAAFAHGFEAYGLDILQRYEKMIRETGETYLWYFPDGRPSTKETSTSPEARPTDGWGSSAMLGAFIEGLCGIKDQRKLFEAVRLSPHWAVTELKHAAVDVAYGASGAGIGYDWQLRDDGCDLTIRAKQTHVDLHLLLPAGKQVARVQVDGKAMPFTASVVESSNYIDAAIEVEGESELRLQFVK